ncbi:MauE/DoxX family redox-associated membrane protein, partial [Trebonia sp.]|uniref:MauE/DoxX family redox-associated membrane protein n=1 Tax=Trebonia sp. TaxID=2767075 RepID=UPI00262E60B3
MGELGVLGAVREVQIPLLAALLLGAVAAKASRAISAGSIAAGIKPTGMFPFWLRRPAAMAMCCGELALGLGLLVTAGRIGAGPPAVVVRTATALLFGTAVGALHVLRTRQPDAGCGCFGDLSDTPVSWRVQVRSALLCAAAVATIGEPPLRLPASGGQAATVLTVLAVEVLVLATLSPEIGEIMVRLGYSEPCEVRRLPVSRTVATLRASSQWRRYRRYIVSTEPTDVWREGCWRFVVFPAMLASRRVEVVFAVYLKPRRPTVRAAIFDATADRSAHKAADGFAATVASFITAPRRVPGSGADAPAAPAAAQAASAALPG